MQGCSRLPLALALLATWAVVTAPSGATVTVSGKRGRGDAEVGLWLLNVATLVLGFLGSCCVARPQAMNGTKTRMAMVFMLIGGIAYEAIMVADALGG